MRRLRRAIECVFHLKDYALEVDVLRRCAILAQREPYWHLSHRPRDPSTDALSQ